MAVVPGSNPLVPLPNEKDLTRGNVYIDQAEIMTLESFPPQFRIHITGKLSRYFYPAR
jgi:hypothetical protein